VVGDRPRLAREHRHVVAELGQFPGQMAAVHALATAVRVAPVDEERHVQRARQGRIGARHEETRMEARPPQRQARPPAPTWGRSARGLASGPVPDQISPSMLSRSHAVSDPRWSPSATRLAWVDAFDGRSDLVVANANGEGPALVVTADGGAGGG